MDRGGRAEGSATGIAVGKTLVGHFPVARARMTRRGRLSRPDDARIRARTVRVGSHDAERSLTIFEDTLLRRAKRTSEAATSGLNTAGEEKTPTGDRSVAHFFVQEMGERGSRNAFRGLHIRRASIGTSDAHIELRLRRRIPAANPRTSRPCPSIPARERRSRAASCTPRATSCPFPSSSSWPP